MPSENSVRSYVATIRDDLMNPPEPHNHETWTAWRKWRREIIAKIAGLDPEVKDLAEQFERWYPNANISTTDWLCLGFIQVKYDLDAFEKTHSQPEAMQIMTYQSFQRDVVASGRPCRGGCTADCLFRADHQIYGAVLCHHTNRPCERQHLSEVVDALTVYPIDHLPFPKHCLLEVTND